MSLHGSIEMNGRVLGRWTAQRAVDGLGVGPNLYKCEIRMDGDADHDGFQARLEVVHHYSDGALALASKVLSHALMLEMQNTRLGRSG